MLPCQAKMTSKDKSGGLVLRLARKLSCRNARFDVYLDDIRLASGETIHDYLVVEPRVRTATSVTGVAVLPVVDGRIGLLKIYRHPVQAFSWEIPRGFVDPGESDIASAVRELEEETGLQCVRDDVVSYGLITPEPGILAASVHLFAALRCTVKSVYRANEMGHMEFCLLELQHVASMINSSEIRDPCTLIACFRYLLANKAG